MPRLTRNSVQRDLRAIQRSFAAIGQALERLALAAQASRAAGAVAPARPPRQLTLSPERRASLELQGQYMGRLRGLQPAQQAQVKALKLKKGFRSAIALAKKLARE